jgi:acyl-CoA reductase-like NAD-dependent aldehyde dehydrogenase
LVQRSATLEVARPALRSVNPARPSDVVFECDATSPADAAAAVATADAGARSWAALPAGRRATVLTAAGEAIERRGDELTHLVTREEGKTLAAATGEVRKTAEQFRFSAQLAHHVEGTTYADESPGTFAYTLRAPLGVVVAITPWNFPVSLAARKIAPALAAGNAVVLKPSPVAAGSGALLAEICQEAGVPPEVLALVHGDDPDAMAALVGAPEVRAVSFTGSDAVGATLRRTANPAARLQFELGGHNAALVCADADIARAAQAVAAGAFELTGQACTATDRVLVARPVLEEFTAALVAQVERMRVGAGEAPSTTVGPVATAAQHERLTTLLASAREAGARVLGTATVDPDTDPDGYWVAPSVLSGVPADHPVNSGEIFGPLLSVLPVDSVDEATAQVNASEHGLVAAIHTRDLGTAHRFARRAQCGIVKINERTTGNGVAPPFGGWKASSAGAFPEGGRTALDFVTDTKTVYCGFQED